MRVIKNIIVALFPLMIVCSCGKWLDVTPKGQVGLAKMFSNEKGFEDVLFGCYTSMTKGTVYGGELTFGALDAMAQYYKTDETFHLYNELSTFTYTGSKALSFIENAWLGNYYTIANCNIILEHLGKANKGIFFNGHNPFIEAEARALRAYLHFDLLRIFAPAWSDGSDKAIPYADKMQAAPFKQLTSKQVIDKIIADLEFAKETLKDIDPVFDERFKDPIYHYVQPMGITKSEFLDFRAYRMNYFAVTATLARVHQYLGNKDLAYQYANEVLKNKDRFPFTPEGDFSEPENTRDAVMKNEILFALHHPAIHKQFTATNFYVFEKDIIYDTPEDFRKYLLKDQSSNQVSLKYLLRGTSSSEKIPMIRITEMFYIAAESIFEKDKELACSLLDEARLNRGLISSIDRSISMADFVKELTLEYRREFIGEGQLFYRYKRLGGNMLKGKAEIEMKQSDYTLPLPAVEVEFGDYNL